MSVQFVILGIMVLALIMLLLWFLPSQLYKQARKIANLSEEVAELHTLVLDLISAQKMMSRRQQQVMTSFSEAPKSHQGLQQPGEIHQWSQDFRLLEQRITELQEQMQAQLSSQAHAEKLWRLQDGEAWGHLLSLLNHVQERLGLLSEKQDLEANQQNEQLTDTLRSELQQLQSLSEEIMSLHKRLQRSLITIEQPAAKRRSRVTTPLDTLPVRHN